MGRKHNHFRAEYAEDPMYNSILRHTRYEKVQPYAVTLVLNLLKSMGLKLE